MGSVVRRMLTQLLSEGLNMSNEVRNVSIYFVGFIQLRFHCLCFTRNENLVIIRRVSHSFYFSYRFYFMEVSVSFGRLAVV